MNGPRQWPGEKRTIQDPISRAAVSQLTNYKGHSHHLYFTNSGWFDRNRRLLFASDREGRSNLFSVCLETGAIEQHTDADMPGPPLDTSFLYCSLNPLRPEAYFWRGRELTGIDLESNRERVIYAADEAFAVSMTSVTSDGRYVCATLVENLSNSFRVDLLHGYRGFRQLWSAMPLSILLVVPVDGGQAREILRMNHWLGHANASPTQPNLVLYCHEGPWADVDQRMWCCDIDARKSWPVRPHRPGDAIGHEFWLADGLRIGYHGVAGGVSVIGFIRYDNADLVELEMRHKSRHIFSLDDSLIAGDGMREYLLLWRRRGQTLEGPSVLCEHGSAACFQQSHVHPRLNRDGGHVVFTSDRTGYGNVYTAEIPAFESLPALSEVTAVRAAIRGNAL